MADSTVTRPRFRTSAKDLTNQIFGRLTALEPTSDRAGTSIRWRCRCACGSEVKVAAYMLRSGKTKSCGCAQTVMFAAKQHGGTATYGPGSPEYAVWDQMMYRCYIPTSSEYDRYGGRGITVCERWKHFDSFRSDMGLRPTGLSLERIDNNLGYAPDNCKWATRTEQQRNRETNHLLTMNGETLCLAEWSERTGLIAATINGRIRLGWSTERALTTPVRR